MNTRANYPSILQYLTISNDKFRLQIHWMDNRFSLGSKITGRVVQQVVKPLASKGCSGVVGWGSAHLTTTCPPLHLHTCWGCCCCCWREATMCPVGEGQECGMQAWYNANLRSFCDVTGVTWLWLVVTWQLHLGLILMLILIFMLQVARDLSRQGRITCIISILSLSYFSHSSTTCSTDSSSPMSHISWHTLLWDSDHL